MKRLILIALFLLTCVGLQSPSISRGSDKDIAKVISMSPTRGYGGTVSIIATNVPSSSEVWLGIDPPLKLNVASVKTLDTTELQFTFSLPETLKPNTYRIYLDPLTKPVHLIRAGEYVLLDKAQKIDAMPGDPVMGPPIGGQPPASSGRSGNVPPVASNPKPSQYLEKDLDLPLEKPVLGKPGEPPPPPPPPPPPVAPIETPPSIYGKDLFSENSTIMYVIDVSGSMESGVPSYTDENGKTIEKGSRLSQAKVKLIMSIRSLPKNFKFNVNSFDCGVYCWRFTLQQANESNKESAISWIRDLKPMGATGTGPAMAFALNVKDCKLFVLLTDGAPNCGAGDGYGSSACIQEHRQMIAKHNTQKATINVFGIQAWGEFEQFLKDIAGDSCGSYQAVY